MEIIEVRGTGSELQGVGRLSDGRAVFVPGTIPGEKVSVEIIRDGGRFCEARVVDVLEPSEWRREPDCPHYAVCGGCQARHVAYEHTLALKRQKVVDALERIGRLEQPVVRETLGCQTPNRTRNKAEYAVGRDRNGCLAAGLRARDGRTVVPVDDCLLQHEASIALLRWLNHKLPRISNAGSLTGLVTRVNRQGELMAVFCASIPMERAVREWLPELRDAVPALRSVYALVQKIRPTHALDGNCRHVWGERVLEETLGGLKFAMSPQSFFQVNPAQAERLYDLSMDAAACSEGARVLDAYCGVGTLTLYAAKRGAEAFGVEIVPAAIRDAVENAARNGLSGRATFQTGDAALEIPARMRAGQRCDAVILDPPRKGADEKLLRAILQAKPSRVAYVSCDPATLARDCRILSEAYELAWAQPVDMFPYTNHVETVCCLYQKEGLYFSAV